jgi:hypothetical protein
MFTFLCSPRDEIKKKCKYVVSGFNDHKKDVLILKLKFCCNAAFAKCEH